VNGVSERRRKMKFKAYDKINKKKIDLYRITLSKDGFPVSVIDLDGEHYGMHQIELRQEYQDIDDVNISCSEADNEIYIHCHGLGFAITVDIPIGHSFDDINPKYNIGTGIFNHIVKE
jgi:hypothetical protein